MSEVSDATQIIVVAGKAIYRIGATGVKSAVAVIKLLNTIYLGKWKGKTSLGHLRQSKGDDMVFINISSEDKQVLKAFEKEMKAHGILCARMPDLCGGDGRTQYAIGASDISKVKPLLLDHSVGRYRDIPAGLISEQDYLGSGIMPDGKMSPEMSALYGTANLNIPGEQQTHGEMVRTEGNTDLLKIHELANASRNDEYMFINYRPLLQEENFAVYAMPDGITGLVIEQTKGQQVHGHQAVVFADRDYHVVSFMTGQISKFKGSQVLLAMKVESLRGKNNALKSLAKEKRAQLSETIIKELSEKVR